MMNFNPNKGVEQTNVPPSPSPSPSLLNTPVPDPNTKQKLVKNAASSSMKHLPTEFFTAKMTRRVGQLNSFITSSIANLANHILEIGKWKMGEAEWKFRLSVNTAIIEGKAVNVKEVLSAHSKSISQSQLDDFLGTAFRWGRMDIFQELLSDGRGMSQKALDKAVDEKLNYLERTLEPDDNCASHREVEKLIKLISTGTPLSQDMREKAVLFASSRGYVKLLITLLSQGDIRVSVRDSALAIVRNSAHVVSFYPKNNQKEIGIILAAHGSFPADEISKMIEKEEKEALLRAVKHRGCTVNTIKSAFSARTIDQDEFDNLVIAAAFHASLDVLRELFSSGRTISQPKLDIALKEVFSPRGSERFQELLLEGRMISKQCLDDLADEVLSESPMGYRGLPISSDTRREMLFQLIKTGVNFSQNIREKAVLFAAKKGYVALLKALLNQGGIRKKVRDSATTQAPPKYQKRIHSMLSKAQVVVDNP